VRTAFTDLLGIEHPIASAGMARVAQAPLVAAVSEAGGLGCLGGVSFLPDDLRDEIQAIRRATDHPFAVNLLVPPTLVDPDAPSWDAVEARWLALPPPDRAKLRGVEAMLTGVEAGDLGLERRDRRVDEGVAALGQLAAEPPRSVTDASALRDSSALKTLFLPGEMGERFKVLLLRKGSRSSGPLPGRDLRGWL